MELAIKKKQEEQASLKTTFNSRNEELVHIDQEIERVGDRFHMV